MDDILSLSKDIKQIIRKIQTLKHINNQKAMSDFFTSNIAKIVFF